MQTLPKVLFVLKRREDYNDDSSYQSKGVSTGMLNSSTFVSDMLNAAGVESKVVTVIDNNGIDKEVTAFKPTHVFIEGYWVVPEKFAVLVSLHPTVNWTVRCHSEMPFLAQEGIAMDWTFGYWDQGINVSGNSPRINSELTLLAKQYQVGPLDLRVPYLPNFYPVDMTRSTLSPLDDDTIDIGCFGAIRPLKNQLSQAVAAIAFADRTQMGMRFHINHGRNEMMGANVLKNIRALFDHLPQYELVEHQWCDHESFKDVIGSMDLNMQVSFTETFNIVSADSINEGIPVVGSSEIPWLDAPFADPTSVSSMVDVMFEVLRQPERYADKSKKSLRKYSTATQKQWLEFLIVEAPPAIKNDFWNFVVKIADDVEDAVVKMEDDTVNLFHRMFK
jgi:hypothetical protein